MCTNTFSQASVTDPVQGLDYDFYRLPAFPDFADINPGNFVNSGTTNGLDLNAEPGVDPNQPDASNNDIAYVYSGFLQVDAEATYRFSFTQTDDFARLFVDDLLVASGNFLSPTGPGAFLCLEPGFYPLRVEYLEAGGAARLELSYSINGGNFVPVPNSVYFRSDDACLGDANGDGSINVGDFIAVLLNFGSDGSNGGDADSNAVVNVADFIAVLLNFGTNCS